MFDRNGVPLIFCIVLPKDFGVVTLVFTMRHNLGLGTTTVQKQVTILFLVIQVAKVDS